MAVLDAYCLIYSGGQGKKIPRAPEFEASWVPHVILTKKSVCVGGGETK